MEEFLAKLQGLLAELQEQAGSAMENANPMEAFHGVLAAVLPVCCGLLRIAAVIVAAVVVFRCISSLFKEKTGREFWGHLTTESGLRFLLHHWENTVGRAGRSDVVLDFPTVSRAHAALLRDDQGNWKLHPLQTKNGTRLNGRQVDSTVPIKTGDTLSFGGVPMQFYAVSQQEEREDAMRWGVAERRLRPGRTLRFLTVFQIMMLLQSLPGHEPQEMGLIAACFGVLAAAMWGLYGVYRALRRTAFEAETLAFFLCTISFGVISAYSPSNLPRQTFCMLAGVCFFLFMSVLLRDLRAVVSLRWPVAVFTCALLIFNVVLGQRLFGAKNWISFGPVSLQPSEFVKVFFLFTGAATLDRLFAKRNLIFTVLFCGFCMGCLALMSDFGTALIFFVALLIIAFLRSGDIGFLALMATAAGAGGWLILQFKPYIAARFSAWRHVWEYSTTSGGYQQTRTMSAIASGGLFGKGPDGAFLKHLGAANTDLVFGVVSEEFGLLLALLAVAVLVALALAAVRCSSAARSSYYVIAANGAAAMIIFQAALNVLGAVDILPLTGVTFPFVSVGGSSMISCWGLLAFLKAADTRPNASFTLKLPGRIRGWVPPEDIPEYEEDDLPPEDAVYEEDFETGAPYSFRYPDESGPMPEEPPYIPPDESPRQEEELPPVEEPTQFWGGSLFGGRRDRR